MNISNDMFTTKRTVNHRTKHIETRIQRQVVIEDGKVISDTGPLVTTKTLEDNKQDIDEIEEKYDFIPNESLDHQFEMNRKDDKTKKTPMKKFMYGYGNSKTEKISQENLFDHNANRMVDSYRKPKKFYFGQNLKDTELNNYESTAQINSRGSSSSSKSGMKMKEALHNSEEQDCQFVYEYSDFTRSCNTND
ncbi:hypothetical protein BLOT_003773 [Blomia tropicalis]|nr:hypothetical protein BLOT_003773 [Blomia tropicalis]